MSKGIRLITVEPKLFPGELCIVKNYRIRARESWELGKVMNVKASIGSDRRVKITFDVLLDRKTEKGRGIWLYVGNDSIEAQK